MNRRLFITISVTMTLVMCCLFLLLLFCFPDHFPGEPQRGKLESTIATALAILALPLVGLVKLIGKDPPYFWVTAPLLFLLSGMFWAILVERTLHWTATKGAQSGTTKQKAEPAR